MAYDTIMVFHDRFKNHILPDQIHILNVAFLVPDMRREFGGCAGNIAYNLKLLGGDPVIMATVGDDFPPYRDRLNQLGWTRAISAPFRGPSPPRPSSPPTWTTTRSPPSIRAP
jgi:adenosine kinase